MQHFLRPSSLFYRKTEMMHIDPESLDLSVSKKKAKKRIREARQREAEHAPVDDTGVEPSSPTNHSVLEKTCKPSSGTEVLYTAPTNIPMGLFLFTSFGGKNAFICG